MIKQKEIELGILAKGFHNIDNIIYESFDNFPETGLVNIFVKHTSAGIMINENADYDVRADLDILLNKLAPEGEPFYRHTMEGVDDMPAHFKSSVFGQSVSIPITNRSMNLGMWQSVFFCEFRNNGGPRKVVVTIYY
ncbi:MAG: YjbQ family protein [Lentimicrobiaceae bacterium]|jgi:secondary thiamine-phosphate synthase enzyme|nr:YjbQ family protein [Lentimicrobiaceae bacterium]MCP4910887.1 YjbQ family protein [Bacteroidota bacterium]MBT3453743.1 YjbQ family protein [Lentimicrobiaceae bacterium]MBT3819532.1 YjbQ family protein [Lentimicrobiaceae bacterium]MBT4061673.1 YjbQ family protein [Lentimicrobiaceae bacterium]